MIQSVGAVPIEAHAVTENRELSFVMRRIIVQATTLGLSWSCWRDNSGHFWLFTGEMSLPLSRERGAPVLQVMQYREGGLQDTANWVAAGGGHWRRCVD